MAINEQVLKQAVIECIDELLDENNDQVGVSLEIGEKFIKFTVHVGESSMKFTLRAESEGSLIALSTNAYVLGPMINLAKEILRVIPG